MTAFKPLRNAAPQCHGAATVLLVKLHPQQAGTASYWKSQSCIFLNFRSDQIRVGFTRSGFCEAFQSQITTPSPWLSGVSRLKVIGSSLLVAHLPSGARCGWTSAFWSNDAACSAVQLKLPKQRQPRADRMAIAKHLAALVYQSVNIHQDFEIILDWISLLTFVTRKLKYY